MHACCDRRLAGFVAALLAIMSFGPFQARPARAAPACDTPAHFAWLGQSLTRVGRLLTRGEPVTIVAVGSSSTAGAGASSPEASYPGQLQAALQRKFPGQPISVLNRGVNGEEAAEMVARFDATVLEARPDLVIWQVGTNAVLRDLSIDGEAPLIRDGVRKLKSSGADVVLMTPQFAPKVLDKFDLFYMIDLIGVTAKAEGAGLFQRFALMRHWYEVDRMPFEEFISPDGLHMNDWSYACVGRVMADAIAQAADNARVVAGAVSRR